MRDVHGNLSDRDKRENCAYSVDSEERRSDADEINLSDTEQGPPPFAVRKLLLPGKLLSLPFVNGSQRPFPAV